MERKHTFAVTVEDRPGVLTHVVGLIARRGFNIDTINAGNCGEEDKTRICVVVDVADDDELKQIYHQIAKLVEVVKVEDLTSTPSINREMALIKVKALAEHRAGIIDIVHIFRAKIVDVHPETMVIEMTGDEDKIDAICLLLAEMGIIEVVRSGKIAINRN